MKDSNLKAYQYHQKQLKEIKRSTVLFTEWLESRVDLTNKKIMDLACGGGGNLLYLAKRYPSSQFVGVDYDKEIMEICAEKPENMCMEIGDWYNLNPKYIGQFDGVLSFQTLVSMDDYVEPIKRICDLSPEWIALTSLFYEGKVNFYIVVDDHSGNLPEWGNDGKAHYNIYSLPLLEELFFNMGYRHFEYKKFEIDIDLPRPKENTMGTYTEKTASNERLQISGPLLMPWYFVLAKR